jgi:hypothetical protein
MNKLITYRNLHVEQLTALLGVRLRAADFRILDRTPHLETKKGVFELRI